MALLDKQLFSAETETSENTMAIAAGGIGLMSVPVSLNTALKLLNTER